MIFLIVIRWQKSCGKRVKVGRHRCIGICLLQRIGGCDERESVEKAIL